MNQDISKKYKIILMLLLILLNIAIRIPSIPHEKGDDSFFIHSLANSVSYYGEAKWWINWMSIFGFYPYSYSSAAPFILSGLSQLTKFQMEFTILMFCIIMGLFSIFSSYLLAIVLYKDFIPRFIFSLIFSLSAGVVGLTTWEITTRGPFLVLFPFFLYLVFKLINLQIKFFVLMIMTIILLFALHHYTYLALFFSIIILVFAIIYKFKQRINFNKVITHNFNINNMYLLILILLFITPFFGIGKLITSGSRYTWLLDMLIITVRNLGVVFPLAIGGFIYLSIKNNKKMEEWAILICIIPTIIFSYNKTYGYMTTYLFMTYLSTVGLYNIMISYNRNKKKIVYWIIVAFIILNVSFSSFFSHWRSGMMGGSSEWYMQDETYKTGEWVKEYIDEKMNALSTGIEISRMYASYGGKPALFLEDDVSNYINKFMALDLNNTYSNSPFSLSYYFDNPIILKSGTSSDGKVIWISKFSIYDVRLRDFLQNYNISYFFQDMHSSNILANSLSQSNNNNIYDSGRMRIWVI